MKLRGGRGAQEQPVFAGHLWLEGTIGGSGNVKMGIDGHCFSPGIDML